MLTFKNITVRNAAMLRRYYENCDYALCEYSAGVKLMWRSALRYAWAEAAGCLIIRCESEGRVSFDYPVAGPDGDEDAALSAIEAYCMETGIQPEISIVPEEKAPVLLSRYPYVRVSNIRTWRDYLYYKEDLQLFAGRRYSGQRNHIKKFYAQWPNAEFRPLSVKEDAEAIEQFWIDFKAEFPKDSGSKAMAELELSKKMMAMPDKPWLLRGGMFDGEKLIALSLCEKCGETLIIHIEKALYSYAGAYPAMVQAEVAAFGDGCAYVNREDDAGDRGLRTSKLQYGPAKLSPKYHFLPQNELLRHVSAIPELKTERLTLSAITEADIPAYNALVLDSDRNRWWGYDDVGGLDTDLGQGGVNVSGGQKQRLCIARAILKKPKVLILDDSTSAVDTATDAKIRQAFRQDLPGTTKLIVAQRVTSVMDADLILVMDDGAVAAQGTHEELMKTCEIYREVYESQQEGVSIGG